MKERPILFSGDMVRAILEGRKTQTRRVVKPQPKVVTKSRLGWRREHGLKMPCPYGQPGDAEWQSGQPTEDGWYYIRDFLHEGAGGDNRAIWYNAKDEVWGWDQDDDPEGMYADGFQWSGWKRPGDRLWVRETWSHDGPDLETVRARCEDMLVGGITYGPYYRATESAPDTLTWKPSIHMPRWACRLLLDVKAVRVERLQDITQADAIAEGCPADPSPGRSASVVFHDLWDSLNEKRGYGWDTNPWVWVIEFGVDDAG